MTDSAALLSSVSTWRARGVDRMAMAAGIVLLALFAIALGGRALAPFDPQQVTVGPPLLPPGLAHVMGTDELGRDVLSRVISGIRISMFVGISSTVISIVVGVAMGSVAGFFGGILDDLLMRVTELFMVIPRFFLALVFAAIFGQTVFNVIVAIGVLSWPIVARIVRSEFLTLRTRQFVDAARVAGAGSASLLFVEILPNALGPVIVAATLQVGQAILIETSLAYLGIGDPNDVSLGRILYQSQSIMRVAWWTALFPGLMIFLAVISSNVVGDALNDRFNPRART